MREGPLSLLRSLAPTDHRGPHCLFATIATAAHYTGEHISFGHVKFFRFPLRIEVGSVLCVRAFSADLQVGRNPPCVSPHWRYLWSGRDGGVAIIGVERRSVVLSIHHRRRPSCCYWKRAGLGFRGAESAGIDTPRTPANSLALTGLSRPHLSLPDHCDDAHYPAEHISLARAKFSRSRVSWRSCRRVR